VSDASVCEALRSIARLVVVEAPAGCGKTHQGAELVSDIARSSRNRILILTHTHAACSVFADRAHELGSRVEIRTIDSLIGEIAAAYHSGIGITADPMVWVRQNQKNGYAKLAEKVARLLALYPMIANALAKRYPVVVCDEHQDSSESQHAIVMSLYKGGAKLCVFVDPMQSIFNDASRKSWDELVKAADRVEQLDYPHRWSGGCPRLGQWTLEARAALKGGGKVDLRSAPSSVTWISAKNLAQKQLDFRLETADGRPIRAFAKNHGSMLVLTRYNETAVSIRSFFNRDILLWEGHTRSALDRLVRSLDQSTSPGEIGKAVVDFMNEVAVGFSPSQFGNVFLEELANGCAKKRTGKPGLIQQLARLVLDSPDHSGVANMLAKVLEFRQLEHPFTEIKIDSQRELWDAIRLGRFETPADGLADLAHRRAYARTCPPDRAISTIHKAKGLECDSVIVMPCDARSFPDKFEARCLLYVALTRAKINLMLVLSEDSPSPLFLL